jgi:hypothetical protein
MRTSPVEGEAHTDRDARRVPEDGFRSRGSADLDKSEMSDVRPPGN